MSLHGLYSDIWANLWTPSIWTLLSIAASHVLHRKHTGARIDHLEELLGSRPPLTGGEAAPGRIRRPRSPRRSPPGANP